MALDRALPGGPGGGGGGGLDQPRVFYFGSTGGGVWKTTDGGDYWENVSDGFFKTRLGRRASPSRASDPNVDLRRAWARRCIRGNVSHGDGVYKSTDAGKTWTHLGLDATRATSASVRVHPTNPDIGLRRRARPRSTARTTERGVYRSRDGGATWEHVLFRSEDAGAVDLVHGPEQPARPVRRASGRRAATPWSLTSGGAGQRPVQVDRRRRHLDRDLAQQGPAQGRPGQDRRRGLGRATRARLGDRRGREGRRLPLRRRRRDLGRGYRATASCASAPGTTTTSIADPQDAETVWVLNVEAWQVERRRQDLQHASPCRTATTTTCGSTRAIPQRMIEGNDGGATVTFNGGDVVVDASTTSRPRSSTT